MPKNNQKRMELIVMKKALKLRCSGFSIIALLVAVLSATGSVGVNENNIQ